MLSGDGHMHAIQIQSIQWITAPRESGSVLLYGEASRGMPSSNTMRNACRQMYSQLMHDTAMRNAKVSGSSKLDAFTEVVLQG